MADIETFSLDFIRDLRSASAPTRYDFRGSGLSDRDSIDFSDCRWTCVSGGEGTPMMHRPSPAVA